MLIPTVKRVYINPCFDTYNPLNGHFTFRGGPSDTVTALITLAVNSLSVLYAPPFPVYSNPATQWIEFKYNQATGNLYALFYEDSLSLFYLTQVDPVNAGMTMIDSLPGITAISTCGFTTFNSADAHYIFSGQDINGISRLYSVDVQNGDIVYSPIFPPSGGGYFSGLHYHPTEGLIYALHRNLADSMFLIRIDPVTGSFEKRGYIPTVQYIDGEESSLDVLHERYLFKAQIVDSLGNPTPLLYSVSLADAHIVSAPLYPHTNDNQDNFIQIHFDEIRDKLFALHWDYQTTSINTLSIQEKSLTLYPNPAKETLTISTPFSFLGIMPSNGDLKILNDCGQLVIEKEVIFPYSEKIDLSKLRTGIYNVILHAGKITLTNSFLKE